MYTYINIYSSYIYILQIVYNPEAATGGVLWEKMFLEILHISQQNTCGRVSFLIKMQAQSCNFVKEKILAQVFSWKFCKISKNTFFIERLRVTASNNYLISLSFRI